MKTKLTLATRIGMAVLFLAIVPSAFGGVIADRAALQALLGGTGTLADFETYVIAAGEAARLDCVTLDASATCNGQGPGLVPAGIRITWGTGGGQLDAPGYYGAVSKEVLSGFPPGQPLVIDFTTAVGAFGVDLRAFAEFEASATLRVFSADDVTVIGTMSDILLPASGALVFAGFEDAGGIGKVVLTQAGQPWSPVIDNVEFGPIGATSAPEPSTMLLCGLALLGLHRFSKRS